jgi:hypothetical protein
MQSIPMALQWTPGFTPLSPQTLAGIVNMSPWSYAFSYVFPYILALLCGLALGNLHVNTPPSMSSQASAATVHMSSCSYEFSYILALPCGSAVDSGLPL